MKRKILSAVLVAAMAVGMMTGCGDSKDNNSSKATEKETLGESTAFFSGLRI